MPVVEEMKLVHQIDQTLVGLVCELHICEPIQITYNPFPNKHISIEQLSQ